MGDTLDGPAWRRNAIFAVVFVVAVLLGRSSRLAGSDIALVWPAAAVSAVWMLRARSSLEAVASGVLIVVCSSLSTMVTGVELELSVGFAFVNLMIGGGTAALLGLRGGARLREPADLAWMIGSVALATGVAAVFGAVLLHLISHAPIGQTTFVFWTRNGVTTFLGVTLVATIPRRSQWLDRSGVTVTRRRLIGDVAVWVFAMTVYALVFVVNVGAPLAYFALPVGVLIALRWSTAVCVWHLLASDVFVLTATALGRGPFVDAEPVLRAILAQGLIGCALLVVLTVALYRDSRDRLVRDLNRAHGELQEASVKLQRSALHDSLTGLANRQQLMEVLSGEVARARKSGRRVGVVFMDLNGFKAVNDSFGHAEGDLLLDAVATRLRAFLRAGDSVARLGGDEFVMVCPGLGAPGQLGVIAARLDEHLRQPYVLSSGRTHGDVSASLGTAESNRDSSAEQLLHAADAQMYAAKRGRSRPLTVGVAARR